MLKNLKLWKKTLLGIIALLIIAILGFVIWASIAAKADFVTLDKFLTSYGDSLTVKSNGSYWEISPKYCTPDKCSKGVIFYPGAKVDPQAYFYKLSFLSQDHKLFITKPPLNLAFFNINQADDIIANNPEINNWAIGGHSLGGAMACEYARGNPDKLTGLFLVGSYCNSDISKAKLKVISIHGYLDGVLKPEKLKESAKNLPPDYLDFSIAGMNHAQAGNYGEQAGDKPATVSDEEVKNQIQNILQTNL
jgi:Alpha/beta hydrolase family